MFSKLYQVLALFFLLVALTSASGAASNATSSSLSSSISEDLSEIASNAASDSLSESEVASEASSNATSESIVSSASSSLSLSQEQSPSLSESAVASEVASSAASEAASSAASSAVSVVMSEAMSNATADYLAASCPEQRITDFNTQASTAICLAEAGTCLGNTDVTIPQSYEPCFLELSALIAVGDYSEAAIRAAILTVNESKTVDVLECLVEGCFPTTTLAPTTITTSSGVYATVASLVVMMAAMFI